jgi:hypothetical protein
VCGDPRLITAAGEGDTQTLTLNWLPKGHFEDGARTIAGYLKSLGCDEFEFEIESGRRE